MATPLATAFVRIRPDTSTFKRDTDTAITRARLGDSGKRAGHSFMTGFRGAIIGIGSVLAGAFAVKAGFDMFSGFVADARDAQRVSRITAATIKATGGAANVTAAQVAGLANQLMLLTGVDDETIKAGQNMLLTFRNVRNEAGKGNDVFNRASRDLLDMTAALHGGQVTSEGMRKTAIQLGKALNDPVLGLTALRRVGVTFTKQQGEMIRRWAEHGQVLRAQKYILRELEREFGGTAKAAADPMSRLRTMFREVGESIGTWLLGPLTKVVDFITNKVVPKIGGWWRKTAGPAAKKGTTFLGQAWGALVQGRTSASAQAAVPGQVRGREPAPPPPAWQQFLVAIHGWLVKIGNYWNTTLWPGVKRFIDFIRPGFADWWGALKQLWKAAQELWRAFQPLIGPTVKAELVLIGAAFRVIGWVLNHLVMPAVVWFARETAKAVRSVVDAFKTAAGNIRGSWDNLTKWLAAAWSALWNGAVGMFRGVVMKILNFFGLILSGAHAMLGWVPWLKGPLDRAVAMFRKMKEGINAELGGVNNRTVDVGVKFSLGAVGHRVAARGLFVRDGTTPTADDVLIAASKGELVVPANLVRAGAVDHLRGQIPGFASGGMPGGGGVTVRAHTPPESTVRTLIARGIYDLAKKWAEGAAAGFAGIGAGTGAQIARFALGYRGVPYVWGGTSPITGWDCSGATSYWYHHFGYPIPRTSQQQQLWARPSPPVAGALAFYYGTGGRASHVGLSLGNGQIINAYGTGYGTIISPLRMAGYSGAGIPPGGFVSPSRAGKLGQGKISAISRFFGGGLITEPVAGVGLRSGRGYALGERGVERVTPGPGLAGDLGPLLARLDRLITAAEKAPARTGGALAEAMNRTGRRAAYGGMYGG